MAELHEAIAGLCGRFSVLSVPTNYVETLVI